jgi:O-methyltransferase involved in polyketide biosynthesis
MAMAATHRAVHQLLEHGHIFSDPLAVAILGVDQDEAAGQSRQTPSSRRMQLFISIRNRFAQDTLVAAYERGVRQLLVLGAGLDTYAYRDALRNGLRAFEIDHLARDSADLTQASCATSLEAAGFDPRQRTFVTWLGVVPYLTEAAVWASLSVIAALPGGAEVVFDYSNPPHRFSPERRVAPQQVEHERRALPVDDLSETSLIHFETAELHERLRALGLVEFNDLGPVQIAQRYLPEVSAPVSGAGGHIIHAATA